MIKKPLLYTTLIAFMALSLSSCYFDGSPMKRIQGEGPLVTKEIDLPRINGLVIRNSADVVLSQGDGQRFTVEAQENIIDNLKTEVSNGVLYVGSRRPVWRTRPVKIKLRIRDLSEVRISGSGDIVSDNRFTGLDELEVRISGSGDINLDVEADNVYGQIGGSGSISLDGESRTVDFTINGSGSIYAFNLESKRANARISGSGNIHLYATSQLDARISGSGDIIYRGNPDLDSSISGSGNIRSR